MSGSPSPRRRHLQPDHLDVCPLHPGISAQSDRFPEPQPYAGYDTINTQYNHSLEISLNKAFTPTWLGHQAARLTLDNSSARQESRGPTLYVNSLSAVTLGGGYINFPDTRLPLPERHPFGGPQNFIEVGEDLAWSKGKHQFTFGGSFINIKDNAPSALMRRPSTRLFKPVNRVPCRTLLAAPWVVAVALDPQGAYPCYRDAGGHYQITAACTIQEPVSSPNFLAARIVTRTAQPTQTNLGRFA